MPGRSESVLKLRYEVRPTLECLKVSLLMVSNQLVFIEPVVAPELAIGVRLRMVKAAKRERLTIRTSAAKSTESDVRHLGRISPADDAWLLVYPGPPMIQIALFFRLPPGVFRHAWTG